MKAAAACLLILAPAALADRWALQYFYDEARTELALADIAFPDVRRGIAVGTIYDQPDRSKGAKDIALLTADAGAHWSMVPLQDHPRSLFFLNESRGWMVGDDAIWFTEESGRTWKKLSPQIKPDRKLRPKPDGGLILRVWFLDAMHGFGIGLQKGLFETRDGGRTWMPVAEAAKPEANAAYTAYSQIGFVGGRVGLIMGTSSPPRRVVDPFVPVREVPKLTIQLQTVDAGAKWDVKTAPVFGTIRSLRLAGRDGLAVMVFNDQFDWPSEVYHLSLTAGDSDRVFREKNRRVMDAAIFDQDGGRRAFLAAVEPPGILNSSPIPGKVKILSSTDLSQWTEMQVDYRAVAHALVLTGPDAKNLWCATDTGMILHLVDETHD
jgi:hypothetical protein